MQEKCFCGTLVRCSCEEFSNNFARKRESSRCILWAEINTQKEEEDRKIILLMF